MDKNSHFKVSTERPQKLVGMIIRPNGKLKKKKKNHYILRYTKAQQDTT